MASDWLERNMWTNNRGVVLLIFSAVLVNWDTIPECGLTQRAPDWWESARFQAVCVAWSGFRQSGVVASHPPAGNANRWVADLQNSESFYVHEKGFVIQPSSWKAKSLFRGGLLQSIWVFFHWVKVGFQFRSWQVWVIAHGVGCKVGELSSAKSRLVNNRFIFRLCHFGLGSLLRGWFCRLSKLACFLFVFLSSKLSL